MKKILITTFALSLAVPALAAQQDIAQLSAVTASRGALRTAINTQLSAVQANFDELYPIIEAGPVYVNASAPADTKVVWIDTDQDNAIKINISGTWTVVGTVGGAGDNLGSAVYTDVVALWTTCTGYLKSDGTCDTPSGSATYPSAAGVANWNGSAWGTSYTVGTAANNLVQLNASAQLPAVSAALLTSFPTLNQNTTGTAAGLTAQYIDWNASSGGASIANKPTLGTASGYNVGTGANNIVQLNSSAELPFTIDLSDLTDTIGILTGKQAADADLTTYAGITPSANVQSLLGAANYAAMRALLDLESGTDFNAYDADLTTWAGVTPGTGVTTALANAASGAGGVTITVASGTSALGTSAISSGACASVVTTTATNVATTDVVGWGFNSSPTSTTGYQASADGMLTIIAYPSANNVNFLVCNNTASSITPGAVSLNWRVIR